MISRQEQSPTARQRRRTANVPWNGVAYLARQELRRTWRSYLWALVMALLMGVAAAFLLTKSSGQGADSDYQLYPAVLNGVFVFLIAVLPRSSNWHSGEYRSTGWRVPSNEHLAFLRSLPLSLGQITAARALASVISVVVLCAIFFTPLYLLSGLLREELGAAGCLLFATFWVGVALAFESVGLLTELSFSGAVGFLMYMLVLCVFTGVVTSMAGQGASAVGGAIELTQDFGAFPALAALGGGCGALALSCLATSTRLRKKETK